MATFLLNNVILSLKRNDEIGTVLLASVIPDIIVQTEDPEAQFRGFVALGTLLTVNDINQKQSITSRILDNTSFTQKLELYTTQHSNEAEFKREKCACQVKNILIN